MRSDMIREYMQHLNNKGTSLGHSAELHLEHARESCWNADSKLAINKLTRYYFV